MSEPGADVAIQRAASGWDFRWRILLPILGGIGLASLLASIPWWAAALGWLLLTPAFAGLALAVCGHALDPVATPSWRAAGRFFGVFALLETMVLAATAIQTRALMQSGSLGWALLLGLLLAVIWLLLWSRWPLLLWAWSSALLPKHGLRLGTGVNPLPAIAAWGPGWRRDEHSGLPYRGLALAALALLLLCLGPLLCLFADSVWHWLAAALLAQLAWVGLYAPGLAAVQAGALSQRAQPIGIASAEPHATASAPPAATEDQELALYEALRQAQVEQVLQLIDTSNPRALPLPGHADQRSALMLAALLSDLRPLRALIAQSLDVNAVHAGLTALLLVTRDSYQGRSEAVTTLLANGADPGLADAEGNLPLHHAARSSDPAVCAALLDAGTPIDVANRAGLTPLAVACGCGNWRVASYLIDRGASAHGDAHHPPLLSAAAGDDDATGVRLLLRHKAAVNACGRFQRSALHEAALAGNADIATLLIDAGADVDTQDERGSAPLHEAARAGADAVIAALQRAHADPTRLDQAGCNALNIACRSRRATVATLRALLQMGVDAEHAAHDGKTPLQQASASGRWALVAVLDPDCQLPASVVQDGSDDLPLPPLPERLLQALCEQRYDAAQDWLDHETLADADLFDLALSLAQRDDGLPALDWLCRRGWLDDRLCNAAGDGLAFVLLAQGQSAMAAIEVLLAAAVSVSGRGGLVHFLNASVIAEQTTRSGETFALSLLDAGIDPFGRVLDCEAALILALRQGWMRLLERLLAIGCDPEQRARSGHTALQLACSIGLEPAVRLLVRYGASAEARSPDGQTARGMALASGRSDLSRWLNWSGWRPPRRPLQAADLCLAASSGDREAVESLLDLGLSLHARDAQGCTALLRAAGSGQLAVVDLLLHRGADPASAADSGATPLSAAISMGHRGVVEALLASGARVEQRLPGGVTPLLVAAAVGQAGLVDFLLDHDADAAAEDENGNTALLAAAQYLASHGGRGQGLAMLQRLLAAGVDVDAANRSGHVALLLVLGTRMEVGARLDESAVLAGLEKLLAHGVDLERQDRRGYGPLHLAALHGLSRVVSRLLHAGARAALRDHLGRSAHDIAVMRGFVDIAQLFEPHPQPSLARYLKPDGGRQT